MNCLSCGQENLIGAHFCHICGASFAAPPDLATAPEDRLEMTSGFVGRQREMAELRSALRDAGAGQGRLVMLAGEPGIGKTRTSQELAAYAQARGTEVIWVN